MAKKFKREDWDVGLGEKYWFASVSDKGKWKTVAKTPYTPFTLTSVKQTDAWGRRVLKLWKKKRWRGIKEVV